MKLYHVYDEEYDLGLYTIEEVKSEIENRLADSMNEHYDKISKEYQDIIKKYSTIKELSNDKEIELLMNFIGFECDVYQAKKEFGSLLNLVNNVLVNKINALLTN